jgi:hypothetical protein
LVDPANGDFHLQSISPAIDAGTSTAATDDFEGDERPRSGDGLGPALWDIGADEYVPTLSFEPTGLVYLPLIMSADPLAQVCLN